MIYCINNIKPENMVLFAYPILPTGLALYKFKGE